jgi:hypothetical protein
MKRFPHLRYFALAGAVLLSAGVFTPARAQADPDDVKRAVARVSMINGDVSVRRGDSGDWVAAAINAPLLSNDDLVTGQDARAEIEFDASNVLRVGPNAEVKFAQLEYGRYQLEVARGSVTFRVLRPTDANIEVDTPNVSVRPLKQGAYRITVNEAGESEVTARAGSVEVFSPAGSQWVNAGQTLMARGASSDPEFQIANATPPDSWDRWNDVRDRAALASTSYQYVPEGVYGAEDLDRSGNWENVPDYGYCWRPTVSVDWAPYSMGRWAWEDWYGWTWISSDPWGWAPYHYGRWFNRGNMGWYWYPGGQGRHFWSPALVGFIGWGGGGMGFGYGNIGWVPLAPYEVFHPWWGRSYYGRAGFNRNMNFTNGNIASVYRNAGFRNGITGLRGADFAGGRFGNVSHYTGSQIRDVSVVRGGMPVAPGTAHLRFSDREVTNAPRTSGNTRFFTHQQPSAAGQRIPFAQQQRAFEQAGMPVRGGMAGAATGASDRGAVPSGLRQGSGAPAQGGNRQGVGPAAQQPADRGWTRFGGQSGPSAAPRVSPSAPAQNGPAVNRAPSAQPASQSRGGWQRFGDSGSRTSQPAPAAAERQAAPQPQADRGWSRFGSPQVNRPQPQAQPSQQQAPPRQQQYRNEPTPSYNAPRFSPPPAQRPSAPRYSAPAPSAPRSAPSSGGGGNRGSGRR